MASHQRKLIRDAVVAALKAGSTAAGDRVYPTRAINFRGAKDLPAIALYITDEDSDHEQTAPRELTRTAELRIEGYIQPRNEDRLDDELDDLALAIETIMHKDPYFGDVAADSYLAGTEIEALEVKGDRTIGMVALSYEFTYRTEAPEAPTDLDDFLTVDATYQHTEAGADDVAEDLFEVQEAAS